MRNCLSTPGPSWSQICTCHDRRAVGTCTNFPSDRTTRIRIREKFNYGLIIPLWNGPRGRSWFAGGNNSLANSCTYPMHHVVIIMYRYENATGRKHCPHAARGDYFQSMIYKRSIMYVIYCLSHQIRYIGRCVNIEICSVITEWNAKAMDISNVILKLAKPSVVLHAGPNFKAFHENNRCFYISLFFEMWIRHLFEDKCILVSARIQLELSHDVNMWSVST